MKIIRQRLTEQLFLDRKETELFHFYYYATFFLTGKAVSNVVYTQSDGVEFRTPSINDRTFRVTKRVRTLPIDRNKNCF